MYFWSCERAANIHPYANVSFPLISSKIGSKNKIFVFKYFNHSHFRTNMALRIKFHAQYVFTKMLIFSYNNKQIHPYVSLQYLKSIPFVQKARAFILRFSTKISRLLKLKDLCTVQSKRF